MKITRSDNAFLEARENNNGNLVVGIGLSVLGLISLVGMFKLPWWVGIIILVIGLLVIVTRKSVLIQLNKQAGNGSVQIKSIIKKAVVNFNLSDVQKIQLLSEYHTNRSSNGNQSEQLETRLLLFLKNGQIVDLSDKSSSFGIGLLGISRVPNKAVAQQLANFIPVPLEEMGPMGIQQASPQGFVA